MAVPLPEGGEEQSRVCVAVRRLEHVRRWRVRGGQALSGLSLHNLQP